MKTFISLNKQIECNQVCSIITKLINESAKSIENISECVLVIEIQKPEDYVAIPKIECK